MEESFAKRNNPMNAAMKPWVGKLAWILILIADAGVLAWGIAAALFPDQLLGPGGMPILPAGYEGFSRAPWSVLMTTSPLTAGYITVLFRMYAVFNVVFALMAIPITVMAFRRGERWAWWTLLIGNTLAFVSAMTYDRTVNAIGPFELSEYLGLAVVYAALAVTAPLVAVRGGLTTADAKRLSQ